MLHRDLTLNKESDVSGLRLENLTDSKNYSKKKLFNLYCNISKTSQVRSKHLKFIVKPLVYNTISYQFNPIEPTTSLLRPSIQFFSIHTRIQKKNRGNASSIKLAVRKTYNRRMDLKQTYNYVVYIEI